MMMPSSNRQLPSNETLIEGGMIGSDFDASSGTMEHGHVAMMMKDLSIPSVHYAHHPTTSKSNGGGSSSSNGNGNTVDDVGLGDKKNVDSSKKRQDSLENGQQTQQQQQPYIVPDNCNGSVINVKKDTSPPLATPQQHEQQQQQQTRRRRQPPQRQPQEMETKEAKSMLPSSSNNKDHHKPKKDPLRRYRGNKIHMSKRRPPKLDFKCFFSFRIRVMVLSTLLLLSLGASIGVYCYIKFDERLEFTSNFKIVSRELLQNFETAVERKLNSVNTISTSITSYALDKNQSFPFVTIPDYAVRGSNVRSLADATVIHWLPYVSNENHFKWEEYAMEQRFHINDAFKQDQMLRQQQDINFDLLLGGEEKEEEDDEKKEPSPPAQEPSEPDPYTLDDGSGYHTKIWDFKTHEVKENGTGPFLPFWQTSPINGLLQRNLNFDFGGTPALKGVLPVVLDSQKAVLNSVVIPIPGGRANLNANLLLSQYRHDSEQYKEDPLTFMAYPVFTSFDPQNKKVGGVLATLLYWRLYFKNILSENVGGIICVINNMPYNQTFAYRVDGKEATYLGSVDPHNAKYDPLVLTENVNAYVQNLAGPETRSYTTVGLHGTYGQYVISIYPTSDFENDFVTNKPMIYALIVGGVFLLTSIVFAYLLSRALAQHAQVETERNMTAYFAHELRNPLGAIDSALQSMSPDSNHATDDTITEGEDCFSESTRELISGMQICTSFMSNLMNNLLDARQLQEGKMILHPHPASLHDILTHVYTMLEPSVKPNVQYRTVFHTNRINPQTNKVENYDYVYCDVHRFRQVMTNVITNAIKYTLEGSITLSIGWDDACDNVCNNGMFSEEKKESRDVAASNGVGEFHIVRFTCEDTGPGIPKSQQNQLFQRFVQRGGAPGSGLGLAIAKLIVDQMGGSIRFESDPTVKPGTACIVRVPMEICARPHHHGDDHSSTIFQTGSSEIGPPPSSPKPLLPGENSAETKKHIFSLIQNIPKNGMLKSPITSTERNKQLSHANRSHPHHHKKKQNQSPIVQEISFLIVDDIKMNRSMLRRRLQKAIALNCKVYEASSGEEALAILAGVGSAGAGVSSPAVSRDQNGTKTGAASIVDDDVEQQRQQGQSQQSLPQYPERFDVIFVDQYMEEAGGVMLGTDTVFAMRRRNVDSFIIGCSGNDMDSEFLEAGANIFWGKPLPSNAEIISQLRRGLEVQA